MTISSSTAQTLPNDRNRVFDAFDSMGASTGALVADVPFGLGAIKETPSGTQVDGSNIALVGGTAAAAGATYVGVNALRARIDPATGVRRDKLDMAAHGVGSLTAAGIRVTPTLVSAVAGPAMADAITAVAPKLVKKKRDLAKITDTTEKKKVEKDNQVAKYTRMAVGGVGIGAVGLAAFMIRPSLFRGLSDDRVKFISDAAIQGRTFYRFEHEGRIVQNDFIGRKSEAEILAAIRESGRVAPRAGVGLKIRHQQGIDPFGGKSGHDIPGNAITSNRVVVGAIGAAGTLGMANAAAGADEEQRAAMWAGTAGVAAGTIAGTVGVGALTARMIQSRGHDTLLARNTALPKIPINMDTLKSYGKVVGVTGIPAGTSAGMYFNTFDDLDDITSTRSQFRK